MIRNRSTVESILFWESLCTSKRPWKILTEPQGSFLFMMHARCRKMVPEGDLYHVYTGLYQVFTSPNQEKY
jgi:hypothetical protein